MKHPDSSNVSIYGPDPMKTLGILLIAVSAAGCGQANSQFFGTWQLTSGTTTYTCTNPNSTTTTNDQGNLSLRPEYNSNDVVAIDQLGCDLTWAPNGMVATLNSGQKCTATVNGFTGSFTFSQGTMTLTDTTHMTGTGQGSGTISLGNATSNCTLAHTWSALKVSNE